MKSGKIVLAGDHAGYDYKKEISQFLQSMEFEVEDYGTNSKESCDYPDFIHPSAEAIENGLFEKGIFICGSANGVCMTANKHQGIRAALAWNEEIAALSRQHNNANAVCIPARYVSIDLAKNIIKTFLSTEFEGGRHENRVNKISK